MQLSKISPLTGLEPTWGTRVYLNVAPDGTQNAFSPKLGVGIDSEVFIAGSGLVNSSKFNALAIS
jgi:hypothetical protein